MLDSSVNHLPQCNPLYQHEAHILWKLMTKEEKLEQRYVHASWEEVEDMDKEGATLKNGEGS